jgi:hypothetical protein
LMQALRFVFNNQVVRPSWHSRFGVV